jgi:hypothetical protein
MEPKSHRRIGSYRLVHLVVEKGMGEVWVADHLERVKRGVALKVIKAGRTRSKCAPLTGSVKRLNVNSKPAGSTGSDEMTAEWPVEEQEIRSSAKGSARNLSRWRKLDMEA